MTANHEVYQIEQITCVAKDICSLRFRGNIDAKPGQYIMIWLPGIDEKPFGISSLGEDYFTVTICRRGPFTDKLLKLQSGDQVGIRGPYGNGFTLQGKRIALVAGGYGIGPLNFLAETARHVGIEVDLIIGARTRDLLVRCEGTCHFATDDGSEGFKGDVVGLFYELLKTHGYDYVYSVGPELMMKKVVDKCFEMNLGCQISLERYIKCAIGICGQCCVDDTGERMCVDGPVITKEKTIKISEFGKYTRTSSGRIKRL